MQFGTDFTGKVKARTTLLKITWDLLLKYF